MVCIEKIDNYKFEENNDKISTFEGLTVHKSTKNGKPFGYMDFENPTKETAAAYYQGMVDVLRRQKNFQKSEQYEDQKNFDDGQNIDSINQQTTAKKYTLSNGHSILENDLQYPGNMSGFADRILIALLVSFGLGAITAATYIFIELGKVTISLS